MNVLLFTALIAFGSVIAGMLGALTGLGGGVVLIPLLVLCGVKYRLAAGAALIAVIATSSGAAASYVKEGYSNIRIGMFFEVATTIGALVGASVMHLVPIPAIAILFGLVLLFSAYQAWHTRHPQSAADPPDPLATRLRLNGSFPTPDGPRYYHIYHVPMGFLLMFIAGVLSGLLGIGSGAMKVLAMDQIMRMPFKVSTTTSNFMIGVTAAASAGIYLRSGLIDPGLTMPVMLGVLTGSMVGAHILVGAKTSNLRRIFTVVIFALALQMIYKGVSEALMK
jgi:uncharacterized membrane protein YfcA